MMEAPKPNRKTPFCLFLALFVCASIPQTVFCQTEKLGVVEYTPPKGWNKTTKENVVAFSEIDQTTGSFCIITLYGATPGTGKPETDFKREWNNLVVKPLKAETNPETQTKAADGWTAIAGGAAVEVQGGKAVALLTVISGGGKIISILGVFNHESYATRLEAFSESIELGKAVPETPAPPREESLPREPSPDIAPMHAAALVR